MDEQLELIRSSLMPRESLQSSGADHTITSADSPYRIHFSCADRPAFQVKSERMGREEALGWAVWVDEKMAESWDEALATGYPLFYMISTHFLPLLQDHPTNVHSDPPAERPIHQTAYQPAHLLFTSHHLLSPTKRRLLASLASQLHLRGFGKLGYPGIIFAQGDLPDLEVFAGQVKSWQWLALRLRVLEPDPSSDAGERPGRGEWEEVGKVGEALEWLRGVGKEYLLTDAGIGVGSSAR